MAIIFIRNETTAERLEIGWTDGLHLGRYARICCLQLDINAEERSSNFASVGEHQNLTTLYGYEAHPDAKYIVFEHGTDASIFRQQVDYVDNLKRAIRGIVQGLRYIHARGYVHVDLQNFASYCFVSDVLDGQPIQEVKISRQMCRVSGCRARGRVHTPESNLSDLALFFVKFFSGPGVTLADFAYRAGVISSPFQLPCLPGFFPGLEILKEKMPNLPSRYEVEIRDFVEHLFRQLSSDELIDHILFWGPYKRSSFIKDIHEKCVEKHQLGNGTSGTYRNNVFNAEICNISSWAGNDWSFIDKGVWDDLHYVPPPTSEQPTVQQQQPSQHPALIMGEPPLDCSKVHGYDVALSGMYGAAGALGLLYSQPQQKQWHQPYGPRHLVRGVRHLSVHMARFEASGQELYSKLGGKYENVTEGMINYILSIQPNLLVDARRAVVKHISKEDVHFKQYLGSSDVIYDRN